MSEKKQRQKHIRRRALTLKRRAKIRAERVYADRKNARRMRHVYK